MEKSVLHYEVAACVEYDDGTVVAVDPEESKPDYWTVYTRYKNGIAEAESDHPTKMEALASAYWRQTRDGFGFPIKGHFCTTEMLIPGIVLIGPEENALMVSVHIPPEACGAVIAAAVFAEQHDLIEHISVHGAHTRCTYSNNIVDAGTVAQCSIEVDRQRNINVRLPIGENCYHLAAPLPLKYI